MCGVERLKPIWHLLTSPAACLAYSNYSNIPSSGFMFITKQIYFGNTLHNILRRLQYKRGSIVVNIQIYSFLEVDPMWSCLSHILVIKEKTDILFLIELLVGNQTCHVPPVSLKSMNNMVKTD